MGPADVLGVPAQRAHPAGRQLRDVLAVEDDRSLGRLQQPGDQPAGWSSCRNRIRPPGTVSRRGTPRNPARRRPAQRQPAVAAAPAGPGSACAARTPVTAPSPLAPDHAVRDAHRSPSSVPECGVQESTGSRRDRRLCAGNDIRCCPWHTSRDHRFGAVESQEGWVTKPHHAREPSDQLHIAAGRVPADQSQPCGGGRSGHGSPARRRAPCPDTRVPEPAAGPGRIGRTWPVRGCTGKDGLDGAGLDLPQRWTQRRDRVQRQYPRSQGDTVED